MSRPPSRPMRPPLLTLITPSASPPHRTQDSVPPLKRQRLSTPRRSASTNENGPDVNKERGDSVQRLMGTWRQLEERWTRRMDEDDIVDLRTLDVVENHGVLEAMPEAQGFGIADVEKGKGKGKGKENVHKEEDDEDSEDDLDAITGFDVHDRPIEEEVLSDDHISTTDEEEGPPLLEEEEEDLSPIIGHYAKIDVKNAEDALDLKAFLEAERKRRELCGEVDVESVEDAVDLRDLQDADQTNLPDSDSTSEDELAPRTDKAPTPSPSKVKQTTFKTPKTPLKVSTSKAFPHQLQTPPRSSSFSSPSREPTEATRLPSPLPPSPPRASRTKSRRPSVGATPKPAARAPDALPRVDLAQMRKTPSRTTSAKEPNPRLRAEVVIVRQKPQPTPSKAKGKRVEEKRVVSPAPAPSPSPSSSPPPFSSPLKDKGKAKVVYPSSESEDDDLYLRKPPPRRRSQSTVPPSRKRKRVSSLSSSHMSSPPRTFLSDTEDHHIDTRKHRSSSRAKSRVPSSDPEETYPSRAGPSNQWAAHPHKVHRSRSKSKHRSSDSEDDELLQTTRPSSGASHPPSSDPAFYPYPAPYPPNVLPYMDAQQAILQAMHHLSTYLSGPWPPGSPIKGAGPPPPLPFTPSRRHHPSSAYSTPTHAHPYPYAYDPNLSRGTLPPSSPEVDSSPLRHNQHRASSIVARSRSRGRRVSFKFEAQEDDDDDDDEDEDEEVPLPPKKPKKKEDSSSSQKAEGSRTKVRGKGKKSVQTSSSESESQNDVPPAQRGRPKSRAQTPGPKGSRALNGANDHVKRTRHHSTEAKGR